VESVGKEWIKLLSKHLSEYQNKDGAISLTKEDFTIASQSRRKQK
jgi:hypothetical protein